MLGDERLELPDELRRRPLVIGLDPLLEGGDALLLEPRSLQRQLAVAERSAAPEAKRLAQELRSARRLAPPRRRDELVEVRTSTSPSTR